MVTVTSLAEMRGLACQFMPSPASTRAPSRIDMAWQSAFRFAFPIACTCWQLRCSRHEGALVRYTLGDRCSWYVHPIVPNGTFQEAASIAERRRKWRHDVSWPRRSGSQHIG